ncbi:hypothetical protein, partial [Candidatus Trichorickettsia mobilis]|uniref:hypothetical protein n=1 Tax=Candidatus Trichorickettsia mobilis TaxID=1346319 RepID=UPI002B25A2B5
MEKKPKFLKNLLTTTSAIAVIAGGVNSTALGATLQTNLNPAHLAPGVGAVIGLTGNFNDGVDDIQLNGPHDLVTDANVNLSAKAIDINGNAHQTFTVGHVVVYGGGNDLDMNLVLNAGSITIQDITDPADDVTVNGGALTMNDAGHDLKVNGGTAAAHDVANDVIITNGAITALNNVTRHVTITGAGTVVQAGTIGGNLSVGAGG